MTYPEIQNVLDGYVTCALWSSIDDNDVPMDRDHDEDDIAPESLAAMRADVERFLSENADDLEGMESAQIGHDLWLTRNHHGAGFWDRGLGEKGDRLTTAAQAMKESDLYVGDDGKLYVA